MMKNAFYFKLKTLLALKILFQYVLIVFNLAYHKNQLYEALQYWSLDMLSFDFLEKSLGIVSPSHFVYNFSHKNISHVMLY